MIIESTYTEGPVQADGRRWVKERHVDDLGDDYEFEWLGDQNVTSVLTARATKLNELIAEQRAADALVSGTLLPLTRLKFRELFTPTERANIDGFRAGLETNALLTAGQKASIRTGFADFDAARNIVRPFLAPVLSMLALFVALGLITQTRADEIIEAGNG